MPDNERPWLRTIPLLSSEGGRSIVRESCAAHGFSENCFFDLVEAQVKKARGERRRRLFDDFDEVFGRMDGDVDQSHCAGQLARVRGSGL